MERMAGIVLAAGESRRMGRAKQLLCAGRQTLLVKVLREALNSSLDRVVLVLGHQEEKVRESLGPAGKHQKLIIVSNRLYREGMSTSLVAGLAPVEREFRRIMVILGDMPDISTALLDRLRKEVEASARPLGAVSVNGRRSHPVVIGREFYNTVKELTGDRGARDLFREHSDRVCLVDAGDAYDASDIDTPEDYDRFSKGTGPRMP